MSSSNNDYSNGNSGVYPLSLYLSSLSGHQDFTRNPYNHQSTASSVQMVSTLPESLVDYMSFNSSTAVNQQGFEIPEGSREIKKVVKKDRHSKIHTAQGLRDRRVRLSIGVARQFFDLQDMLGFDKASETLDWLLKKSRRAIKEVVQEKKVNGGDVEEEEEEDDGGDKSFVYGSSPTSCEEMVCEVKKAEKSNISSKGLRAKAKGKLKEITNDHTENFSKIANDPFKKSIIFSEGEDMTHPFYKEAIQEFDNQQCILAKKVNLSTIMDQRYNQHYGTFMLKNQGSSSNYNIILPQNLDYGYDQNRFMDHTNMNFHRGFP